MVKKKNKSKIAKKAKLKKKVQKVQRAPKRARPRETTRENLIETDYREETGNAGPGDSELTEETEAEPEETEAGLEEGERESEENETEDIDAKTAKLFSMPSIRSSEDLGRRGAGGKQPKIKLKEIKPEKIEEELMRGVFYKPDSQEDLPEIEAEEEPPEYKLKEEPAKPEQKTAISESAEKTPKEKKLFLKDISAPFVNLMKKNAKPSKEASGNTEEAEEEKEAEERVEIEGEGVKSRGKHTVLESYSIEVDKAKVKVEIQKGENGITYNLFIPEIGVATASLLDDIRNELVSVTTISMQEILDPAALKDIKKRFMQVADELLKKKLPSIAPNIEEFLIGKLMQDMLGLGEIEFLVNDPTLEEIVIPSSKEPIRVYCKKYGWLLTNLKISREVEIVNYSNIVARRVGRQITVLTPLLDAHLVSGDRVNAVLYPISTKGNTITIRKFARDPYTIIDLITNNTCSLDIAALLWLAVEYEMNVLISGGTASGKTVLLNACMPFIPPNHRIVSVEDTRELMLPDFLYWTPLVTRTANPEGKGEVSMLDLLVNSLRMRPDRIILGEMRRKEEAMVLFEAMHTGHSVYATVHADSATETISRLTNPPLSIPPNLLRAVNLNAVMFRDRRRGIRRVSQLAEFQTGQDKAEARVLYRYVPEEDKIIKHSESSRLFEDLSRNTGMTQVEINKNLEERQAILSWLIKNKIRDLNDFGKVMNMYYTDKENLKRLIQRNDIKGVLGRS